MILLIDNYDSFVHNLARYFQRLGQETEVVRNDAISVDAVRSANPDALVLSPGPCTPYEAGNSLELVQQLWRELPILGVCLGHQTIAAAFDTRIVRSEPMHGRTSEVLHDGQGVFSGFSNPFVACRYHSLVVDELTLPNCLQVSARTADGVVMGIRHDDRPMVGVQFHPESILTEFGCELLANFLRVAGVPSNESDHIGQELLAPDPPSVVMPVGPVTF